MQQTRQTPTFNMKAVVQETGLKPDTLRAWERRYQLPNPERTEGGHRIYSQRDIDTLKWLIGRQEEGLSISHAVELWNRLEAQGQDPLLVQPVAATSQEPAGGAVFASGETMDGLRREWIASCMAFDERAAEQVLAQAFALYPPERVIFEILQKGLAHIGDGWYEGETTVQQEHFASELANRRLEALVSAAAAPTRPGRVLVGCPPGEEHTFVPLLLTLMLRRRGWDVTYLGANVPVDRLRATLDTTNPQLVVFPAQLLTTAASLLDVAEILREENVPLAYGGRIFTIEPVLRERIPGHYLGTDLETAAQVAEQVLTSPQPPVEAWPADAAHQAALHHYLDRQAAIENRVHERVGQVDMSYARLAMANVELAQNISSALKLGDMYYMAAELEWIEGLIEYHDANSDSLRQFLSAYAEAVDQETDDRGQPIKDWFNDLFQETP